MGGWREHQSSPKRTGLGACVNEAQSNWWGDPSPVEAVNCRRPGEVAVAMKMVWGIWRRLKTIFVVFVLRLYNFDLNKEILNIVISFPLKKKTTESKSLTISSFRFLMNILKSKGGN